MRPVLEHEPDVHRQALEALVDWPLLAAEGMRREERDDLAREPRRAVRVELAEREISTIRVIEFAG